MATVSSLGPQLGIAPTCAALGLPRATYYRRRRPQTGRPPQRPSPRALRAEEQAAVLAVLHEPRFVDLAPAEVYATLLDEGQYLLLRADDVSPLGRRTRRCGSGETSSSIPATRPRAAGPPAQRALELGHHQAPRPGEVDLLLPLRHARCLQPLRRRLDGGPSGERHARRAVHP